MGAQEWLDTLRHRQRICEECGNSFDFYEASDDFSTYFPDYLDLDVQPTYSDYTKEFERVLCGKCAAHVFYDFLSGLYED